MSFGTFLQLLTTFLLSNALGHRDSWALLALGPSARNTLGPGAVVFGKAVRGSLGWCPGAGPCQWQTNPAGCVVYVHVVPAGSHSLIKTMLFPNKYISSRPAPAHLSQIGCGLLSWSRDRQHRACVQLCEVLLFTRTVATPPSPQPCVVHQRMGKRLQDGPSQGCIFVREHRMYRGFLQLVRLQPCLAPAQQHFSGKGAG